MKIVLMHVKADFDALATAWAAYKIHNCDHILYATEMETTVTDFLKSAPSETPLLRVKQSDFKNYKDIELLVITDCKTVKRLGELAELIPISKKIVAYDHHPSYAKDIKIDLEMIDTTGAATTIAVEELFNNNIKITPFEATLFALGIYEDTGLLTFNSTTPRDIRAAAELLERGADLSVTAEYIKRDLGREQIFILNELLMNMSVITVGDINVTYSFASIDEYTEELAYIAHRMMDMEALDSLFILVRTGPRVVLVGRSKIPQVDASIIVSKFGGGGHPAAASAIIKDLELHEAVEILKLTLRNHIRPVRFVKEIMNSPARSLDVNSIFEDALHMTMKHNLNILPIVSKCKTVGLVSRKDILQGIKHGFTDEPIESLMQVEFDVVSPETPFSIAEEIMLSGNQKLLPVEENGKLVGVVTRTDLLRLMHERSIQRSNYEEGAKTRLGLSKVRNVSDLLKNDLPSDIYANLETLSALGVEERVGMYIVGGFVRDLVMGNKNVEHDIDIVVEGDATAIASMYAHKIGGRLAIHDKYKTAMVIMPDGRKIDFAMARTEYYAMPAAIPTVESSSLRNDLIRRDFTVNAMAVKIDGKDFGKLVDFFGGQRDILDKKIRVLHSLSIVDDPSRAYRAVRFAARLGFELGSHTERLLKHAESMGLFSRIVGGRLFVEVKYILSEPSYINAIKMLKKYDILHYIAFGLKLDDHKIAKFNTADTFIDSYSKFFDKSITLWRVRFAILMSDYTIKDFDGFVDRLNIEPKQSKILKELYSKAYFLSITLKKRKEMKGSDLCNLLSPLSDEIIIVAKAIMGNVKNNLIENYYTTLKSIKSDISGDDLKAIGIPPSDIYGTILKDVLSNKIDGIIANKEESIYFITEKYREYITGTSKDLGKNK